jgi:hypothetical protein
MRSSACGMRPSDMSESDEIFHPPGDDPYWNESGWFGFNIPERNINGFVYYFHDVRTGVSGGGPVGFGEDQEFFAREQVRGLIQPGSDAVSP